MTISTRSKIRTPSRHLALALALGCAAGGVAQAQGAGAGAGAGADARAKAKSHYDAGADLAKRGRWDEAIAEYRAAYDMAPLPLILFHLGQAYWQKGDKGAALAAYRKYLGAEPNGRASAEARQRVAELEAEGVAAAVETPSGGVAAAPSGAGVGAAPTVGASPVPPAPVPIAAPAPAASVEPADEPAPRGHGLRTAGLVSLGVGVAAIGAGVYFGLHASSLADEVAKMYSTDKVNEGNDANRNFIILTAAGGAAVVAGGILWYLDSKQDDRPVRVVPYTRAHEAGLSVAGRF
jgi:hypothetical protein